MQRQRLRGTEAQTEKPARERGNIGVRLRTRESYAAGLPQASIQTSSQAEKGGRREEIDGLSPSDWST